MTSDEYLSGNVREKLRQAQAAVAVSPIFEVNVKALEGVQPQDLSASEIDVRLGATWIDKKYIQQFMYETFNTPRRNRRSDYVYAANRYAVAVNFSPLTAEWNITNKRSIPSIDVAAYRTYGTERASAYDLLEAALNLRDVKIYDKAYDADGKEIRVLNQKETTLAQQKQQAIKDAFRDWIWKDPERREDLVREYNERFNSTRPREYDGSHISFAGMNPEINLRPHQRNAIAHILYGGNTLLAHEVGAGKTFEMAAAAMESKRLGLCSKSMFVVPNHLTEQWASEFLPLYPSAKLLVTTKKDFEKKNRKKFCARIATGDYDAVIIGHSQFEKIPISYARQEQLLQNQIDEIIDGISEVKANNGERFSIKQMERTKKQLENRLEKLRAEHKKDDVVTFEELGVDRLYVDEAHSFKNLFAFTKMSNVAGLSTAEAQKSSDMFMKCRYIDELTGNRGIVFATGTPVSNSMVELYTMQRYLQYDTLKPKGMTHFDCWASTFGETVTALELAPEGTGYRTRTRFAKFFNLPELMNMFKEVADIKTADQLNLPTPEAHYENIAVKPSEIQQDMVQALSERAAAVHGHMVDPSTDNMLKITSDGRKLGLDQRLIDPMMPDHPGSKVNACVDNIFRIWQEGQTDKLTQLVFCDLSTPKSSTSARSVPAQQEKDGEKTEAEYPEKTDDGEKAVPNSYGFRVGRGTHDAIEQCFTDLNKGKSPVWILEGDIKGCFDHISHEWLLQNIPMDKGILRKWLKCGYIETRRLFPTEEGTPQGGTISPTLMNMTLDGLERKLREETNKYQTIGGKQHKTKMNFVRYADDFIVTGWTKEFLQEQVLPVIRAFMSERGLQLSEEKTVITHIDDGFDFLGQNIRKYDGKLLIKPSKNAVKTFLEKVRKIVKSSKSATQEQLIRRLNPVIRGWINYHRYVVSSEVFSYVDYQIYKCLWQWAKRRHKHKGHRWIAKKYWHHVGNRVWMFAVELNHANKGAKATYLQLVYATNTKIIRFRKIIGEANPFNEKWAGYYEEREGEKLLNSTKGRERLLTIWRTQNCSCPVCGEKITAETGFKTHTTILSETSRKTIMVHPLCHKRLHEPGYLL